MYLQLGKNCSASYHSPPSLCHISAMFALNRTLTEWTKFEMVFDLAFDKIVLSA